jgi:hypothetical protein
MSTNDDQRKVEFLLNNGADSELLAYSLERAKAHRWRKSVEWLKKLIPSDVADQQLPQINLDYLNSMFEQLPT